LRMDAAVNRDSGRAVIISVLLFKD